MSVVDTIKKSVLENFAGKISVGSMLLSLIVAFIIGMFIVYVYRKTYTGVVYSKAYSLCIIMLAMVTAMIIRTISSNISLSLGMVGALSIVRFRTAIKEPRDLLFLFWSISNGIIIGAGVYSLVFVMSLILTIGLLLFDLIPANKIPYLLVVNTSNNNVTDKIENLFAENNVKYKIKSRNVTKGNTDIVYELHCKDSKDLFNSISKINGINSFNLLSQDGECQF